MSSALLGTLGKDCARRSPSSSPQGDPLRSGPPPPPPPKPFERRRTGGVGLRTFVARLSALVRRVRLSLAGRAGEAPAHLHAETADGDDQSTERRQRTSLKPEMSDTRIRSRTRRSACAVARQLGFDSCQGRDDHGRRASLCSVVGALRPAPSRPVQLRGSVGGRIKRSFLLEGAHFGTPAGAASTKKTADRA